MADREPRGYESELDEELDQYIEEREAGWFGEFLTEQARRAPWWTISLLIHVIALLVMWKWPYHTFAEVESTRTFEVELADEPQEEQIEEPEEEEPEPEEDLDVPIEDIEISEPQIEDPGLDVDLPPAEDMVKDVERPLPTIDPPSNTPVLAVQDNSAASSRGIYSGRNRAGRARAMGGGSGTTARAESAVNAGLRWLVKAQERDGSWSGRSWEGSGDFRVANTGLALLAFLGAGYTHTKGRYKSTVERGLRWLALNQKANGQFGYQTFYEQGIAAMAVSEAYGLTRSPKIGRMAKKAVDYIVAIQPEHGGYRYGGAVPKGEGDMSVTGWQIMAAKSAICSKIPVPDKAIENFRTFLKNSYRDYGKSAYTVGSGGAGGAAIWAIGMVCRQFLGGDYDQEIQAAADELLKHGRNVKGRHGKGSNVFVGDLYFTYYSVLGMYQMGGEWWIEWNRLFRPPLVKAQIHRRFDERGRYVRGSWDPANHRWANRGGRVYSTAMAILSLEVYYRFLPVYRAGKK